ncbi:MAG TPA: PKD domain-containing protein [Parafilimonas sp.]|nr:PKD domain-containing protein [Parafilimonas sp.]
MRVIQKTLIYFFAFFYLHVNAQQADFSSNTQSGCAPLVIQFVDVSTGNPAEWDWDLGNGITSDKQNPGTVYSNPGTYTVKLHIKTASGEDSVTKVDYITVYEYPTVALSATPTIGCAPLSIKFTDNSSAGSGAIQSWIWDFGDGIVSTEQNPTHTYNIADTFNISLIVTNSFGCKKTLVDSSLVKITGVLKAGFSYNYDNVCKPPTTVAFTNTSESNSKLSYQWIFGDGGASTDKDPVHTYTNSGSFPVQLTITNEQGCSETLIQTISVGIAKADFVFTSGCVNEPVVFTDSSSPKPITSKWDFGDGETATGPQVQHLYKIPGSYQVTLVADFGSCKDTLRKSIQTVEKVQADFSEAGNFKSCVYPVTVSFTNKSQGSTRYEWQFGDGTVSTEENPTHTYQSPGQYTVTFIAYNITGCQDSVVKTNLIELGPPEIKELLNLPFEDCVPQTLKLTPVIVSGEPITVYNWDFGDGTFSTEAEPTHTYSKAGIYNVTLAVATATGCSDTFHLAGAVRLGTHPKALFSADPLEPCAESTVQFHDKSTGLITDWHWTFGDNSGSSEQNPDHIYTDTGHFSVTLVVYQYGCYDSLTLSKYIYVKPPIAKFSANSNCDDPYTYKFNDESIGAKSWYWDFGDGHTSDLQNPKYTYTSKGTFTVSLTVINDSCSNTITNTVDVIQENLSFSYESASPEICKYDSIHFSVSPFDSSNIKSFLWDFGDGIQSTQLFKNNELYHFYSNAGIYNPVLITTDKNNCRDTINQNLKLEIFGPNAAFSNVSGDCLFSTINFNDESAGDGTHTITKWIWNYGDGSKTDTLASGPFNHTYNIKGLFNVLLKVTDNKGCYDSVKNINAVQITQPVANFYAQDTLKCAQNTIQFLDSSDGVSLLYKWYFGDGNSSTDPDPMHSYAKEGPYDVKLVLSDKYGCTDSILKSKYVLVANPVADFSIKDSSFVCPPVEIIPENNSLHYSSVIWNFGDGNSSNEITPVHYYTLANSYQLKLIAHGYGDCYDTISKIIIVKGPSADLSYGPLAGCDSLNVSFTAPGKNTIQYIWDFGDGGIKISTNPSAKYHYSRPGKLLPKLVIADSAGCKVTISNGDTVTISGVDALYSAGIYLQTCDSLQYDFTDSSILYYDTIANYQWKFGDGTGSLQFNPHHFYSKSGLYNTNLKVTTKHGCTDDYTLPVNVSIDKTTQIFATIPDSACLRSSVAFTAGSLNGSPADLTWQWIFGDGSQANSKDTTHAYTTAQIYDVLVVGTNLAGCKDTVHDAMRIDPLPPLNAGPDSVICKGQSITLNASGAGYYTWLADASLSCIDCSSPVANPLFNTTYFLTGTNNFGCQSDDSVNIEVKQPTTVSLFAPDTACVGNTIQLQAKGAERYHWQPESQVSNSTDSITSSVASATTMYSVIGSDSKGCFSDTASVTVNVFPYPTLQIPDSVVTINAGDQYKVSTVSSPDIVLWQWLPLAGLSCSNCPEPIIKATTSQVYTVNAQNIAGCSVEKQVTVTVLCKNQNLFIPNTFSPNADGMNDYFYPRGKGLFTIRSFRVFSRIGTIVFERSNFPPNQQSYGWDGKYKGQALQPDVYVYIAEVICDNGTVVSTKGNVTLLR